MGGLTELRQRMEYIRLRLNEIDQLSFEAQELRYEGKRLGDEFRQIRQEQKDAVEFVEGLIDGIA